VLAGCLNRHHSTKQLLLLLLLLLLTPVPSKALMSKASARLLLSLLLQDAVFAHVFSGDRQPFSPADFLFSWWTVADHLAEYQQQAREHVLATAVHPCGGLAQGVVLGCRRSFWQRLRSKHDATRRLLSLPGQLSKAPRPCGMGRGNRPRANERMPLISSWAGLSALGGEQLRCQIV